MADVNAGEADFRPIDLSVKHDQIIQLVAKYVSLSKDPARYQHKLVERTKHSPNFAFLDPSHKHHGYYQFLIRSYTFWYESSYGAQTDYSQNFYGQDVPTVAVADDSQNAFANHFGYAAIGAATPVAPSTMTTYQGYDFSAVAMPSVQIGVSVAPKNAASVPTANAPVVRERTPDNDDEEDEAPRFRIIVENGVKKAVPL